MSKVAEIEGQIKALSPKELTKLRDWFREFDAEAWDEQFERDVKAGKLDRLAKQALEHHAAGRSTKL